MALELIAQHMYPAMSAMGISIIPPVNIMLYVTICILK